MLGDADVAATIAVKDTEKAKKFFQDTLGLELVKESPGGITFKSGSSKLFVYQSQYAGTNKATYAGWSVDDVEATVKELKDKGVSFEQYDMPGVTREGDIHVMGKLKAAWFTDPDGNIFGLDNGEE